VRRLLPLAGCLAAAAAPLLAAEQGEGHGSEMLWRIVNFVILAAVLGVLIRKFAPAFFAARSEKITRELEEARRLTEESDRRARSIQERLASLDVAIQEMRVQAKTEMAAEHARLERETEQAVRKAFLQAEQEMAAAAKAARLELRAYAASLAVGLAEKKIAQRITPQTQHELMNSFVRGLGRVER
jgi:F-type H+-transporting ATPase subunit b